MFFSSSTLLALGLALPAVSPNPGTVMSKRDVDNLPPSDRFVNCNGGYLYSTEQVKKAIQQRIITTSTNEPSPVGGYPHKFSNNKNLGFSSKCDSKTLHEFPPLHGDHVYRGGNSGPHRVVFITYTDNPDTNPTEDGASCGVMTHTDAPQGELNLCKVED